MLILVPIFVIIMIIFAIDLIYFEDVKPTNKPIEKTVEKADNRKNYVNKYLKQ